MNTLDYLSRLRKKNEEKKAPSPNCVNRVKDFTQFMQSTPSAKKADIPESATMTADEERAIRAWLAHIEETDPAIIAEVVDKCRNDLEARRYFLKRSEEVPEQVTASHSIACGDCIHFERIDHPHLGHCAKGEPEAISGLWDTDRRYCERFLPRPKQTNSNQPRPARAET